MMKQLRVVGNWTVSGKTNMPQVELDYPHPQIENISDVAGTPHIPCDPNLGCWEVVCDDKTSEAIARDSRYKVIWMKDLSTEPDEQPVGKPSKVEAAEMTAWLKAAKVPDDVAEASVSVAKDREQIADDLIIWLKDRPKAKATK